MSTKSGLSVDEAGWGARIRTWECRYQKPVPYRLATPQLARFLHGLEVLRNTTAGPAKSRCETLERDGKRGYNPPHRDWQRSRENAAPPPNPVSPS
jgi:hypothetical protein